MNTLRKKIAAITISLFFILSMSASMTLPSGSAHSPPWQIQDHAYIYAQPNPVGVGQLMGIEIWTAQPLPNTLLTNNIRKGNYTLTVTLPNGTISTLWTPADYIENPGGEQAVSYTPTVAGTYKATFVFGGYTYPTLSQVTSTIPLTAAVNASINADAGDIYTAAPTSCNFTVQQQPLTYITNPLPTAYWTRPIESENTAWSAIASNWLGGADGGFGGDTLEATSAAGMNVYQPSGTGPMSAHIMWTQPEEFGGLVGSTDISNVAATFYSGDSYQPRFNNAIVMDGYLYFERPLNNLGTGGGFFCEDLSTGAVVWQSNTIDPTWGQLLDYSDPNQAGDPGGYLFQSLGTTWEAFDAFTGNPLFNITNIPSGTSTKDALGPHGDMDIYVLNYNTATETGSLALWNSTALIQNIYNAGAEYLYTEPTSFVGTGYTYLGNFISPYTWNVTINADLDGLGLNLNTATGVSLTNPSINAVVPGDVLFGTSSGLGQATGNQFTPNPFTMWAINLNATTGPIGKVLWVQNYTAPDLLTGNPNLGSFTERFATLDPTTNVAVMVVDEACQLIGYSAITGTQLWETNNNPDTGYNVAIQDEAQAFSDASGSGMRPVDAYGDVFIAGYGGEIWCYNTANGNLLWQFGNGGEGNSTSDGINTPWGDLPTNINSIVNGEVIASSFEHGNGILSPYYRGESIWALNATTGQQIWSILSQTPNDGGPGYPEGLVADGQFVEYNYYDNQIYNYGQGPSQTTINAPDLGATTATPITITGTVMDVSPGTKQTEQALDFPNGVPCASDASESQWMEYVYMQKAEPTNFTGVTVTLYVLDNNNNYRSIGATTTNSLGDYSYTWTPDIAGKYIVTAVFAGSNAYYGSSDSIGFYASPAATPAPTTAPLSLSSIGNGIAYATIGIVVVIVIIGAVLAMLMLRKRP